jgi:hypothetical protein
MTPAARRRAAKATARQRRKKRRLDYLALTELFKALNL